MFAFAQKNDDRALYESLSEMDVTDDIKDEFLDDPEVMVIGAENDPKIAALIDKIPEDDDADEPTEKDLDKIEEAMFDYESDDNIKDRITSEDEDFSEFDDPTAGKVTEDYESESDSAIDDKITSEDFSEFDDPTAGGVTEDYESESDSAIEDEITSEDEDFSEFDI